MIFIKNKKRAQDSGGGLGLIGTMVLILIVVAVMGKWFIGTKESAAGTTGKINLDQNHQLCELAGKKMVEDGMQPNEPLEGEINFGGRKGDGFPDDCDICLGGDDRQVTNSYGIPDYCYSDPLTNKDIKTYKDMCKKSKKGCYISDTDQCCLLSKSKCGEKCK